MSKNFKRIGRKRQYTEAEIATIPCIRCGAHSSQQFNICALSNRYIAVCSKCDVELNAVVVNFLHLPDAIEIVEKYSQKQGVKL